jgi:hypothetical protein
MTESSGHSVPVFLRCTPLTLNLDILSVESLALEASDPVRLGLGASLRPGDDVTGVTTLKVEMAQKLRVVSNHISNGSAADDGQQFSNREQKRTGNGGQPVPTRGRGRRLGSQNRTTRILKEAVLLAAEQVGEDGEGFDGLVGYLRHIARTEPKAFCALLQRILPMQVTAKMDIDHALRERYPTLQEAERALRELGVPVMRLYQCAEVIECDALEGRDDDCG